MSVPPTNPPGPYTYPDPPVTTPPVDVVDHLAPTLIDPVPARRQVPLWIPIIAVGGLLAAAIFGIANLTNQGKTQAITPVAVVTTTVTPETTAEALAPAATPTQTPLVIVVTATPLPQETPPQPQPTAVPVQPQPTAVPQPAPVTTVADPTATPRPAPTAPPVVAQPTPTQPPAPTQPQPTPVPPTATQAQPTAAPTTTLPAATVAQPTPVPASPTPSKPAPTATLVPLNSQTIGLFRTEWEKWHGQPEERDNGLFYENGKYMVVFYEDRISRLERLYADNPVTLDAARNESKTFLPQDAKLVGTSTGPDNMPVDLYKSEALKTYFASVNDPDFWKGGEPGNFIVQYRKSEKDQNLISAIVITLGNNPQKQP